MSTTTQILHHITTNWGGTDYVGGIARTLGLPREVVLAELRLLAANGAIEFDGVWARGVS